MTSTIAHAKTCQCGRPMRDELFVVRCDQCQADLVNADLVAQREQRKIQLTHEWTDLLTFFNVGGLRNEQHLWLTKLGERVRKVATHWIDQHMRELTVGFGLIGEPGVGKTIATAHCLKAAHMHGHSVAITSDPRLHTLVREMDSRDGIGNAARREYQLLYKARVLMLDDIGQCCVSGESRKLLLSLVNERTLAGLTTLWTSQGGGNWLAGRLGCPPDDKNPGKYLPTEEVRMFLRRLAWPYCSVSIIDPEPVASSNP